MSEEEEVLLEKDMNKPAIAACLIDLLQLEDMWSDHDRKREKEAERVYMEKEKDKERAYLEKLARLVVEKAAMTGHKEGQRFDVTRARSFMPVFDESAVDIFL